MAKHSLGSLILYIFLWLLAILSIIPFIILLVNATRSDMQILSSITLLPGMNLLANIREAAEKTNLLRGFVNSLFISTTATLLTIYFSAFSAYGFAAYRFKGRNLLFSFVLVTMIFPMQLTFIGYFEMIKSYGLLNSYLPLILPAVANAGFVFFLRQYAQQALNISTTESARIDGAGEFLIFNQIILPIFKPAMATIAIFSFIYQWNIFLQPFLILKSRSLHTLPLMIRTIQYSDQYSPSFGATYFALTLSTIPVLIIFIIFSRKIISGLSAGSVKG